jgi:hypothetical protein
MNILKYGYKIPVKMTAEQKATVYREGNNKSARSEMDFLQSEVERLVADGQVIEVKAPVTCTNPLTVAFKVNSDGTIKRRLVIDLSRWVNWMIVPDKFRMARFHDALAQSSRGDYQSVFDVSKAYHHIRLAPESYCLVGFCVEDKDKKERFYHFVVLVFGLGPSGQVLGRVMRPILIFLSLKGIRNIMYVDDGRTAAASKAGFIVAAEKSDRLGDSAQRKEYLGFIIDTEHMRVHVQAMKLARIRKILDEFMKTSRHKVRYIAIDRDWKARVSQAGAR